MWSGRPLRLLSRPEKAAVRSANREPCELLYYGFLPQFLSGMAELIWDGKYDEHGCKPAPVRIELPFQTVETVNESAQDRQRTLELSASGHDPEWRNRLIWGDKKYVLPSLLPEFAGKVDLIYIDPPFDTGADFSFTTTGVARHLSEGTVCFGTESVPRYMGPRLGFLSGLVL